MWINAAYLSFTRQLEATFSNFKSQCAVFMYMIYLINNYVAQYIQKVT